MNASIHPATKLGAVYLTVSDLERAIAFYQRGLGFQLHRRADGTAHLGAGGPDLLVLAERPGAKPAPSHTGLYHFAVLVPSRLELAHALQRLADAQIRLQGAADHLVSEAVYLADPDGNGIEIYRDRPRSEWRYTGSTIQMDSLPLDFSGILAERVTAAATPLTLNPETIIGHVHLQVADIAASEAFYQGVLGFDLMLRFGPSAGFVSAGGYHHHIGYNTWHSAGAVPPPANAAGLRWFVIELPDTEALTAVLARVRATGVLLEERSDGILVRDPSGNGMLLTTSAA